MIIKNELPPNTENMELNKNNFKELPEIKLESYLNQLFNDEFTWGVLEITIKPLYNPKLDSEKITKIYAEEIKKFILENMDKVAQNLSKLIDESSKK